MSTNQLIRKFYPGPFAERLITYILLTEITTFIIFAIFLHINPFRIVQPKQYMFYGLMGMEYAWMALNHRSLKLRFSRMHPVILIGLAMLVQGVIVGLSWGNSTTRIFIDSVNVIVVIANLLLFADERAIRGFDFDRLEFKVQVYSIAMIVLGVVGHAVNSKVVPQLGASEATSIAMAVLFAGVIAGAGRPGQWRRLLILLFVAAMSLPSWNRTTLMFMAVAITLLGLKTVSLRPVRALMVVLCAALIGFFSVGLLPPDSKLAERLNGLENYEPDARTGSIGERSAEMDAVAEKIDWLGPYAVLLGAGHGAEYDVKHTSFIRTDYSNAHFGWALFYLRWGLIGEVYLALWVSFLLYATAKNIQSKRPELLMIALLGVFNIGYMVTYAYYTFFIAGLPFLKIPLRQDKERQIPGKTESMVVME